MNTSFIPEKSLILLCVSLCTCVFWVLLPGTLEQPTKESVCNLYINDSVRQPRTILLWNEVIDDFRWTLPADTVGPSFFKLQGCAIVNCVITNNKYYLPSIDRFDAIFFHVATLPEIQFIAPRHRNRNQLYVFSMVEPPLRTFIDLGKCPGFFNLTMTYRLDSDIPWPYMSMEDIKSGQIVAPALKPHWRQPPAQYADEKLEAIFKAKTKFAVWFVSNCNTTSKREELVGNLQKYMSVDIYGECGLLKCKRYGEECYAMVDKDYKFYLSFENSLCIDYVTEKLKIPFTRHVIPVVFGGADYTRFAPPRSYIDANNFRNAKELANYLKHLSDNPKEYIQYFWWRKYYRVLRVSNMCDICAQMNAPLKKNQLQIYSDIERWWMNSSCYRHSKISLKE